MKLRMDFSASFDFQKTAERLKGKAASAQKVLDALVLRDSNFYCPLDTSTLQKSAIQSSVMGSGKIEWKTPYARKQYYAPFSHEKSRNPNATMKWFETAKSRKLGEWVKTVEREMKK